MIVCVVCIPFYILRMLEFYVSVLACDRLLVSLCRGTDARMTTLHTLCPGITISSRSFESYGGFIPCVLLVEIHS